MEEIFENSILDDLFNIRTAGFECLFSKKYGIEESKKFLVLEKQLEMLVNKYVENENVKQEILTQFEELMLYQISYWKNVYYKLGIADGIKLEKDVKRMYEI